MMGVGDMQRATAPTPSAPAVRVAKQVPTQSDSGIASLPSQAGYLSTTTTSTSFTSVSSSTIDSYIALGCLHFDCPLQDIQSTSPKESWDELLNDYIQDETRSIIGSDITRLLNALWIRLFIYQPESTAPASRSIVRVYLLPEDRARSCIDRNVKSLRVALRQLLFQIDTSPNAWAGDFLPGTEVQPFDPWVGAEPNSLYYLFNKLPSPDPSPSRIKSRYTRKAVQELLESASSSPWDAFGEQPLAGLRTKLYPYQARSASLMIERESAPQLRLDPQLEVRVSPNGQEYYFGARDGSFLQEPRFYETPRGGILAETMGLGKTIICLAVILATKGQQPQIPAMYQPPPPVRDRVGSLADMVASIALTHGIPVQAHVELAEAVRDEHYTLAKRALQRNIPYYEIPPEVARMNRTTRIPPARQLILSSITIIVVPRNLLHQWQSETRKHILLGGLRLLVVDSVPKRSRKAKPVTAESENLEFVSELPAPTELMKYDVILFTRNRFEQEIQDGADAHGRRATAGVSRPCSCPYIGSSRVPDCNCVDSSKIYESPLKKLHFLRIVIDEGHSFSSSVSNAVLVAKQIQAERRWVVSGTPAKNLVGVEVDMSYLNAETSGPSLRQSAIEQRKDFSLDDDTTRAAKALGLLASNFLMVRPWCDSSLEGGLDWDEYIYCHKHQYKKTHSGFSSCFLRTLESLVVKTRPEDVEKDIVLPPMVHRTVYIKPCWFDKMTANMFVQVLRSNAITSERTGADYLFHKNSAKDRHSLIKNLRQSNFTWTGFRLADVESTLDISTQYLTKNLCSEEDRSSLLESSRAISQLSQSKEWKALSKAHEVGVAIEAWPAESEELFALTHPEKPTLLGLTKLLDAQLHVDSNILSKNPSESLAQVGQNARSDINAFNETEEVIKGADDFSVAGSPLSKTGVPASCVGGTPLTSRRASTMASKTSKETKQKEATDEKSARPRKRKLTYADEIARLPVGSPLNKTCVVGTTSAKLTYLIDKMVEHQATKKIIIFYDGDDAAFYIAQSLEMLYINHRIYARTLDNVKRSEYVALFNEDPDVRVLLIDVACGALGLNLNAASVVLIVNPINRPSIEAQAIKRAHRIGQTKEVLVETLVLENTVEHAIFDRARKWSRAQHLEAKEFLEDDAGITEIIQNAQIHAIDPEEEEGMGKYALLETPQQVFGRADRHKYHRFGFTDTKTPEKSRKRPKTSKGRSTARNGVEFVDLTTPVDGGSPSKLPRSNHGHQSAMELDHGGSQQPVLSLFGG